MDSRSAWASALVEAYAADCPEALELALLLSPAVRLESALIRAMRLELLPGSGPWIESRLWYSPLVKSRNVASILLHQAVAEYLRDELSDRWRDSAQRSRLRTARMLMAEVHKNLSPALFLEEQVVWAAIAGDLDEINRELAPAVKALLQSNDRPGLASWAGQALLRLPENAFETEAGQALRLIAQGADESAVATSSSPDQVRDMTQLLSELPLVRIGVARRGSQLQLGTLSPSAPHLIPVPDTDPRLVDLQWEENGLVRRRRLSIPVGGRAETMVGTASIVLRNALGAAFQVPEFGRWAGGEADWIDLSIEVSRADRRIGFVWSHQGSQLVRRQIEYPEKALDLLFPSHFPSGFQEFDDFDRLMRFHETLSEGPPKSADLRLRLDPTVRRLPWEWLLFKSGLATRMVRVEGEGQRRWSSTAAEAIPNRALVAGFGAAPGDSVELVVKQLGEAGFEVALFAGGGGSDLFKRLYEEPWRFLHLSEHQNEVRAAQKQRAQTQSGDVSLRSRLILDEKHALGLKDLLQLRVPPELVVIHSWRTAGQGFADEWGYGLTQAGVAVVLVNDWFVEQPVANCFFDNFYQALRAGSTAAEAVVIARLETELKYPKLHSWAAFQLYGDGDYRLETPGESTVAEPAQRPTADPYGTLAITKLEARQVPEPGLYRLRTLPEFQLLPVTWEALTGDEPILLLIHAMASSTAAQFSDLWSARFRPQWQQISAYYGEHIYCFEHWGLSKTPVENALQLARALPRKARIHLLTLSSGGLMAELLCRAQRIVGPPIDAADLQALSGEQQQLLRQLGELLAQRQWSIDRFIRVACPLRGTNYPMRSKQLLGGVANVLRIVGGAINNVTLRLFEAIADPMKVPGLRAVDPGSPLIALLNRSDVVLDGDLSIVSGTFRADSLKGKLTAKFSGWMLENDNDLVVPTASMLGGSARRRGARCVHFEGGQINHFSYFSQADVVRTIVDRLLSDKAGPVWVPLPDERKPPPELVVLYAADPDDTDLVDQCAATLAPLENAGAVRLRFIASEQLDAPESRRSFATATLLVILVNAQLFDTKAALDELALLLPRSEAQGVHVLVVLDGDSGVDFPGSDDRIVQLTSSG
ncbi:MAG: CHAT domain-containing protein, partial [Gammaproteobacteria bacterium]|nr:CHAT domain-containing protein [Gammaproteobacteria bacterium]